MFFLKMFNKMFSQVVSLFFNSLKFLPIVFEQLLIKIRRRNNFVLCTLFVLIVTVRLLFLLIDLNKFWRILDLKWRMIFGKFFFLIISIWLFKSDFIIGFLFQRWSNIFCIQICFFVDFYLLCINFFFKFLALICKIYLNLPWWIVRRCILVTIFLIIIIILINIYNFGIYG